MQGSVEEHCLAGVLLPGGWAGHMSLLPGMTVPILLPALKGPQVASFLLDFV